MGTLKLKAIEQLFSNSGFKDIDREYLAEPKLSLKKWKSRNINNEIELSIVMTSAHSMMKQALFTIESTDPIAESTAMKQSVRSEADFALLSKKLQSRFPGAFVPPCPESFKSVKVLLLFLQSLARNPFFRNDSVFDDFLNPEVLQFKSIKKQYGISEGSLRWLQQLSIPLKKPVDSTEKYLTSLAEDFDGLHKQQKGLLQSFVLQADALDKMQKAADQMLQSYQSFHDFEANLTRRNIETIGGNPGESLNTCLSETYRMMAKHKSCLESSFSNTQFDELVAEIRYQVSTIAQWKRYIKTLLSKRTSLEKAQTAADKERVAGGKKLEQLQEKHENLLVDFTHHTNGILGIEIVSFRKVRASQAQIMSSKLMEFNYYGGKALSDSWGASGFGNFLAQSDVNHDSANQTWLQGKHSYLAGVSDRKQNAQPTAGDVSFMTVTPPPLDDDHVSFLPAQPPPGSTDKVDTHNVSPYVTSSNTDSPDVEPLPSRRKKSKVPRRSKTRNRKKTVKRKTKNKKATEKRSATAQSNTDDNNSNNDDQRTGVRQAVQVDAKFLKGLTGSLPTKEQDVTLENEDI